MPLFLPIIKNNFAALVAPAVTDDSDIGYSVDSIWVDSTPTPTVVYICTDASIGAALWVLV